MARSFFSSSLVACAATDRAASIHPRALRAAVASSASWAASWLASSSIAHASPAAARRALSLGRYWAPSFSRFSPLRETPGMSSSALSPRRSERRARSARGSLAAAAHTRWKPAERTSRCPSSSGSAPVRLNSTSFAWTSPTAGGAGTPPAGATMEGGASGRPAWRRAACPSSWSSSSMNAPLSSSSLTSSSM